MSFFVKVMPPIKRARIHVGDCKYCRDGQGMENQDKGPGPTYWHPAYPVLGLATVADAHAFVAQLGDRYKDIGECHYCMSGG
jgi:hypothetical protein